MVSYGTAGKKCAENILYAVNVQNFKRGTKGGDERTLHSSSKTE
jgi:hypothetical protein